MELNTEKVIQKYLALRTEKETIEAKTKEKVAGIKANSP